MARYTPTAVRQSDASNPVSTMDTEAIWRCWCRITRGEVAPMPEGLSLEETSRANGIHMTRIASFHAPAGDDDDVERLVRVFEDSAYRREAEGVSMSPRSKPIMFPTDSHANRRKEMLERAKVDESDLSLSEKRALYRLAADRRATRIMDFIDSDTKFASLESMIRDNSLYPSVSKINQATYESFSKKRFPVDSYKAGRKEESLMSEEEIEADADASMMLVYGYSVEQMMEYHCQAPPGYWKAAAAMLSDPVYGGDPEIVYSELESEFGFHPNQREMPDKDER